MSKILLSKFAPLIIAFPSVIIGAIAMFINKIPIAIWGQNIICSMIAGLISYIVLSKKSKCKKIRANGIIILISVILLLLTFIDLGLLGVHRWISIGPVKFYVASIVMPIIIIELWNLLQSEKWWVSAFITILISILLILQPDASELTAFIIPMVILLWSKTNNNILRFSITGVLLIFIVISWISLDGLPPVPYVEEIISLVADMGIIWLILGVISLMILIIPFIFFPPKNFRLLSICIGIYFIIILISTLFGNFPIPLMGYGISPIIGYFISITWLVKVKNNF
ncbi:MAG: cell division protein [Clostridiaceae bacterium]